MRQLLTQPPFEIRAKAPIPQPCGSVPAALERTYEITEAEGHTCQPVSAVCLSKL